MPLADLARLLSPLDAGALALLLVGAAAIGWRIEHSSSTRPSVTALMAEYRRDWMRTFARREVRIFDSQILASLRQSTSFFASTSILAIGGVLALVGNVDPLAGLAEGLTAEAAPRMVWQVKLIVVALFLAAAFLRFVWANRVFGYCAVVMGSVPDAVPETGSDETRAAEIEARALQAAELNIRAAVNFNRGLRSIYFALGASAWLLGAVPLILATLVTLSVLWSREFASIPRRILTRP